MLQYKYRWLYSAMAFFVVITVGIFYLINPKLNAIFKLDKTRENLSEQLFAFKQFSQEKQPSQKNSEIVRSHSDRRGDFLSDLFAMANLNGLSIQFVNFIDPQKNNSSKERMINFAVQGDYQQISSFVHELLKAKDFFILLDFSYKKREKNQFSMEMKAFIPKANHSFHFDPAMLAVQLQNPFCFIGRQQGDITLKLLNSTPLSQMKMIGYVQQDQRKQGMILLANNIIVAVSSGSRLGKEQGVVAAIQKNHILVVMPDKHSRLIKM